MAMQQVTERRFKSVLRQFIADGDFTLTQASKQLGMGRNFCSHTLSSNKKTLRPETVRLLNEKLKCFYENNYKALSQIQNEIPLCADQILKELIGNEPLYSKRHAQSKPVIKPSFWIILKAFILSIFTMKGGH